VADEKVIEGDADHADTMLSENEGHVRCKRWLADEFVVIGMRANPEPNEVLTSFHCESTMVKHAPRTSALAKKDPPLLVKNDPERERDRARERGDDVGEMRVVFEGGRLSPGGL
jgi:hypothetical protein